MIKKGKKYVQNFCLKKTYLSNIFSEGFLKSEAIKAKTNWIPNLTALDSEFTLIGLNWNPHNRYKYMNIMKQVTVKVNWKQH